MECTVRWTELDDSAASWSWARTQPSVPVLVAERSARRAVGHRVTASALEGLARLALASAGPYLDAVGSVGKQPQAK